MGSPKPQVKLAQLNMLRLICFSLMITRKRALIPCAKEETFLIFTNIKISAQEMLPPAV